MGLIYGPSLSSKVTGWRSREAPQRPRDDPLPPTPTSRAVGQRSLALTKIVLGPASRLRPQPLRAPPPAPPGPASPGRARCLRFCRAEGAERNRSCRFAQSPGAWDRAAVTGEQLASPAPGPPHSRLGHGSRRASGPSLNQPLSQPPARVGSAPPRPRLRSSFRPEAEATAGPELQARPLVRPLCGAVSWPRRLAAGTAPAGPAASLRVRRTAGGWGGGRRRGFSGVGALRPGDPPRGDNSALVGRSAALCCSSRGVRGCRTRDSGRKVAAVSPAASAAQQQRRC